MWTAHPGYHLWHIDFFNIVWGAPAIEAFEIQAQCAVKACPRAAPSSRLRLPQARQANPSATVDFDRVGLVPTLFARWTVRGAATAAQFQ